MSAVLIKAARLCLAFAMVSIAIAITHNSALAQSQGKQVAAIAQPGAAGGVAADNTVRGVVRSYETASISSELNAKITFLPTREGDAIRKGELLVEFDCSRILAERDAVSAQVRGHHIVYRNQKNLLKYKAAGTLAVEQAKTELDKSEADLRALQARVSTCRILSPFDGRIAEKLSQVHEVVQPNQPILKLVNETRLEVVMMIPSSWLGRLVRQSEVQIRMDESNTVHRLRILQATGVIDPISQSARVIGEFVQRPDSIVPGTSGTVFFDHLERAK